MIRVEPGYDGVVISTWVEETVPYYFDYKYEGSWQENQSPGFC
jgi:hypothetical protein